MKSKKSKILAAIFTIVIITGAVFVLNNKDPKTQEIEKILRSEFYSYLPDEAKEIIKDNYLQNDALILTEKNQEIDQPYLNPEYVEYLGLSNEERTNLAVVPDIYVTSWSENYPALSQEALENLPSSFDLRNVNGKSYITGLKNQDQLGICWTYAAAEQAESYLLTNKLGAEDPAVIFSPRQIDYATSTNGIANFTNSEFGMRKLTSGGSFMHAAQTMAAGLSFVAHDADIFTTNGTNTLPLQQVLNFDNSQYELKQTASFYYSTSGDNAINTIEDETTYRNALKNAIMTYGGANVGTEAPTGSCGASKGDDGSYIVRVDESCTRDSGHAMQIIGWDDNYDYTYCNVNGVHKNEANCGGYPLITTKGDNPNAERGAWLLRNSWGESSSAAFAYLAYDSLNSDIDIITDLATATEKNWDNEYSNTYIISNPDNDTYSYRLVANDHVVFNKKTDKREKITQVKFYALSANTNYEIYTPDDRTLLKKIDVVNPGYQTVDLSDLNLIVEPEEKIELSVWYGDNLSYILKNSTVITTKNLDDDPAIYAPTETTIVTEPQSGKYHFHIEFDTANIPSGEELDFQLIGPGVYPEYRVLSDGENVYNFEYSNNKVAYNKANVDFSFNDSLYGVYSIVAYYRTSPLNTENPQDPYTIAYVNIGNVKSEIKYKVVQADTGTLSIDEETIDPVSGKLYDGDTLTDDQLVGSTFTPAEDYTINQWTIYDTYENIMEMTEIPYSFILGNSEEFKPAVYNETFYHVYPSTTYYANTKEAEVTFTYKIEVSGLGDYEGPTPYFWITESEDNEDVDNLTSTPVATKTGTALPVTTTATEDDHLSPFFVFEGWYEGDTLVSTDKTFTPAKKGEKYVETTYVAKWRAIRWNFAVDVNDTNFGSVDYTTISLPAVQVENWEGAIFDTTLTTVYDPKDTAITATPAEDTAQYTFSFDSWTVPEVTAHEDDYTYTITANFTRTTRKYPITFVNYDGTTILQQSDVEYGTIPTYSGATPTKSQDDTYTYAFIGWDKEIASVTGEATYKAVFTPEYREYTVTFIANDEIISQKTDYHWGDVVETPETPTKPADVENTYAFTGWNPTVVNVAGNAEYVAIFAPTKNKYTVTFENYDGTVLQSDELEYGTTPAYNGETPTKPADNTYTYTFKGWNVEITEVVGAITYIATYDQEYINYTVRFKIGDDVILEKNDYHYGDLVIAPTTPTKPATAQYTYTFAGWNPAVTNVAGNVDYIATFSSTINKYTIVFRDYAGSSLQSSEFEYGATPVYSGPTPTKPEDNTFTYEFAGWDQEIVTVTGPAEYKATFTKTYKNYAVRFVADGKTVLEKTDYHYGDELAAPEDPIKLADNTYTYTFDGWSPEVPATVTESAEYNAVFSADFIDYTIRFEDYDGTKISETTYHYGDEVIAPENPTRDADKTYTYEFAGWGSEVTTVTGSHTYVATYNPTYINYVIRFEDYDGSQIVETIYHYNSEVIAPADPIREPTPTIKYTFLGWDKEITKVIASETYIATYSSAPYEATAEWLSEATFELGSNKNLKLHIEIPQKYFAHKVTIDDVEIIENTDYLISNGSTIVALQPEFLNTLEAGDHSVKVFYDEDVIVSANFSITIPVPEVPDTGFMTGLVGLVESIALPLLVTITIGSAILIEIKQKNGGA